MWKRFGEHFKVQVDAIKRSPFASEFLGEQVTGERDPHAFETQDLASFEKCLEEAKAAEKRNGQISPFLLEKLQKQYDHIESVWTGKLERSFYVASLQGRVDLELASALALIERNKRPNE